ncbi:hypothetical protein BBAD15_g5117 [Beauveria bassiana D1-5]|uniref:CHAT domain-containing protein n=1 Tax=Beauveria bassiana D1-5 TaxID=1245745 RepID=A0A0A2VT62_BEABA|nr:hypothetical protein BBAD15_g5117 [Beauveria bassiana D1-5]
MSQKALDLNDQAKELEALLASIEPEDADQHIFLGQIYRQLGDVLLEKWHLFQNRHDYDRAEAAFAKSIRLGRLGAQMAAPDIASDQVGEFWAFAAQQATAKFKIFSDSTDLDEAIDCYCRALQSLQGNNNETKAAVLLNLAICLADRFELQDLVNERIEDIEKALECGKQAIDILERHPSALSDVSTMFLARYERLGDGADLQAATELAKEAWTNHNPSNSSIGASTNYANCLRQMYERDGDLTHLNKAIRLYVSSKTQAAIDDSSAPAEILSNLGYALHLRFGALGAAADLHDAINNQLAALEAAETDSKSRVRPVVENNLAACVNSYFHAFLEPEVLEIAISLTRSALESSTQNPMQRSRCLYNLASMLYDKFRVESDASKAERDEILAQALPFVEESTRISGMGDLHVARQHDLWSRILESQFEEADCKQKDVLDTAILKARIAVDAAAHLPGARGDFLVQLGDLLQLSFDHFEDAESFREALSRFQECGLLQSAPILVRIHACHRAALLLERKDQWTDAVDFAEKAVRMLPKLALNAVERGSQQRRLDGLSGLSGLAAALALNAGWTAGKAFELLEAGRCVISKQLSQKPTPLVFESESCDVLETYRGVRQKIDKPLASSRLSDGYPFVLTHEISERVRDIDHAAQLEYKIQAEYGIQPEPFLSEGDLARIASESPVVAYVVTDTGSHALVTKASGTHSVPLADLKLKECAQYYMTMQMPIQGALRCLDFESFFAVNENMKKLLIWLWESAVLPVLVHLEFYSDNKPDSSPELPRVHWLTSGILGMFPLHAAGYHDEQSTANALSHVVSSYTTTVSALNESSSKAKKWTWKDSLSQTKAAFIAMRKSPDSWQDFDMVEEHLESLKQIIRDESNITVLQEPTSTAALAAMLDTPVAHFVCHGVSQPDPSNSSLILCKEETLPDGTLERLVQDPLTVRAISSQMPQNLVLAFLAACQTADNMAMGLVDENIHLVSSFLALGYTNVIGTLWEVEEAASASFAKNFYSCLARRSQAEDHGSCAKKTDIVVRAFHDALLLLRRQDPESPATWATMVCFGA